MEHAETFYEYVVHLNGDKSDNEISNLRYVIVPQEVKDQILNETTIAEEFISDENGLGIL
jgi:hypothetical protein